MTIYTEVEIKNRKNVCSLDIGSNGELLGSSASDYARLKHFDTKALSVEPDGVKEST